MLVVGPIVEGFGGSAATAGSTASNTGTGYDFAINDLEFRVAPGDQNPYQRATAQFRKDQLDTGQNPGDQSLTGWWTRGQFSFHKGAGVTYYEVSEGETVISRYTDAEGLDPFHPGKVSCQQSWDDYSTSVASTSYVAAIDSALVVLDGTTVKYGDFNGSPSTLTPSSGTVKGVTVSPTRGYIVTSAGKVESFTTAGAQVTLYTGLTATARGIWYVKSRLVVSDSDGKWYQFATNPTAPPVAIAAADVIFTGGDDWATSSVVCDTPGPILIGNSNRIFAATLDGTGTIPVFSAPVQVGELPPGETLSALAFHLGFVIIVTGAGVRIGVLSESGQVTYGPLLVERATGTTTPPATSIARYSTRAAVVVDNRIIEIDLSEQVGNGLEFAWTGRGEPFSSGATAAGVTTLQINTQIAWSNAGLWASDADLMAGYVQTGFHRFATLEPKRFDSVRVHLDGTSGTCEIIRVSSDGSELSLFTIDAAETHVEEIPLGFTTAQEVVGLKFVLTPDGDAPTVSPILLGYQVRALPEPQRQRMIRVPLLVQDTERRQPARKAGRTGSAWDRLSALEELENTGAIVTFSDYRTGERGRAYVESVEFRNITPPSAKSTGFGGLGFVTLRKL